MFNVSQAYLNFINDENNIGRSMKNKVVIDGVEYLSDTIKSNPKISHKATTFIGGFPAKTCDFEILNLDGSLSLNNKEITVYKGLDINNSTEWVKMGIFKATDEDITTNQTTKSISFKGKDRAVLFDVSYADTLDWTTAHTGLEIVQSACMQVNVELETESFNFASYSFTEKPNFDENITCREVISRIAEIGGEIAYISRNGGLKIVGQNITNQAAGKGKREKLTREKQFGAVNTVVLGKKDIDDDIVYPAEIAGERTEWKILDNPYVDLIRESIITEVAKHIIGMSITPFTISNFIDDFIYDLNDVISITDNNGNVFNAVVLEYDTSSRIKSNIAASTQSETLTNYKIAGTVKQSIAKVQLQVDHNTQEISSLATKIGDTETLKTEIIQNQDAILMDALKEYVTTGDFETFKTTISTQFEQTAEGFNFTFNNISQQINDLNNSIQEQTTETKKYIRFEDGNIVLGEANNKLVLKIQNNKIAFIQGDTNEVAYFSDNKLTVTHGTFEETLEIGNFAWKPRANGNLSLVYIGGEN